MGVLERVYFKAPVALQHLGLTTACWRVRRRRYGPPFTTRAREYTDRESWDEERIHELRQARLTETLRLAALTPHYRNLFHALGADWRDLTEPSAFAQLPPTLKTDVQQHPEAFRPRPATKTDSSIRTSGTTGSSVEIFKSANAIAEQWAVWWRYRGWHGLDRSTPLALFAGRRVIPEQARAPYWRADLLTDEVRYSSYHLSDATVHAYVAELRRRKAPWIHGFASAVNHLAILMNRAGLSLDFPLTAITLGGENVSAWHRTNIRSAFGIAPVQHYGLAEGVANISECDLGELHVDEDFAYVEFVPRPSSGLMQILGTNFGNDGMVLLRYATNDIASPDAPPCGCGRWGRTVVSLDGRADDSIVLPDGRMVGTLEDAFRDIAGIAEAQITQASNGALQVRYIKASAARHEVERHIEQNMRRFVGHEIAISVTPVATIPRTSAGKTRLVVSELAGR